MVTLYDNECDSTGYELFSKFGKGTWCIYLSTKQQKSNLEQKLVSHGLGSLAKINRVEGGVGGG